MCYWWFLVWGIDCWSGVFWYITREAVSKYHILVGSFHRQYAPTQSSNGSLSPAVTKPGQNHRTDGRCFTFPDPWGPIRTRSQLSSGSCWDTSIMDDLLLPKLNLIKEEVTFTSPQAFLRGTWNLSITSIGLESIGDQSGDQTETEAGLWSSAVGRSSNDADAVNTGPPGGLPAATADRQSHHAPPLHVSRAHTVPP